MKLLKLVYFAHGWYLALTGQELIDEVVEAWKFGPVVPSIYHAFKEWKLSPIQHPANSYRLNGTKFVVETPTIPESDVPVRAFLKRIWEVYGQMSAIELSNLTHQQDTPWYRVWMTTGHRIKGTDIPNAAIREYFVSKQQAPVAANA